MENFWFKLENGKIEEVLNIDKNTISRPFINNQTIFKKRKFNNKIKLMLLKILENLEKKE